MDRSTALFARSSGAENYLHVHSFVRGTLKLPGEYGFTLGVILLMLLHRLRWRASVLVLLGTAVSGVNGLLKWTVGRTRPFKLHADVAEPFVLHPFRGGLRGMFVSTNLCFPSGHAALAFATAAAASILLPAWRWIFYGVAAIVAIERVAENAHWLSDNVAAAALGIGGVHLIYYFWKRRVTNIGPAIEQNSQ